MVAMYNVLGRQVGSHYLAIATLGLTFGGSWLAMRGGGSEKIKTPPTNASSKDEEAFIQEFIKSAEAEEKQAKH